MKKLSALIGFKAVLVCMTQSKKEMFPGACPCHLKWDSGQDGTGEKGEGGKRVILNHFSNYQSNFLTPSTSELGFGRRTQTWRRRPRQLSWRRIERSRSLSLHHHSYPARARSARARRASARSAQGLLLSVSAPTVRWGKTFCCVGGSPSRKRP